MQQSGARRGILERRGEWRKGAEKASDVRDGMERREAQRIGLENPCPSDLWRLGGPGGRATFTKDPANDILKFEKFESLKGFKLRSLKQMNSQGLKTDVCAAQLWINSKTKKKRRHAHSHDL